MNTLSVLLLGRFSIRVNGERVTEFHGQNVQQLFSYLMLNRDRFHNRNSLATVFWPDTPLNQSKAYLRKTLWRLQKDIELCELKSTDIILLETDWIRINPQADIWSDVATLEDTFSLVEGKPDHLLGNETVKYIKEAVNLYRGDLFSGCYQEWCIHKRERIRQIYLILLDKLLGYCLYHKQYDLGILYGNKILSEDYANERTHRRLMRLHYMTGNRAEAIRQFQLCCEFLKRELGVAPTEYTTNVFDAICADEQEVTLVSSSSSSISLLNNENELISDTLDFLRQVRASLSIMQEQIDNKIALMEKLLKD